MFKLSKNSCIKEICRESYSLFSKFGYMDGDDLLPEEAAIVQDACNKLADALGEIDGWFPIVVGTGTHNPFYIIFESTKTKEYRDFWSLDVRTRRKIEEKLEELQSSH
ncbi:MAG: hypothetical protein GTN82_28080 [Candidatus Aminicenantes bacterium]|nr:hypothetical protein [Candidatus Aminicenantes bacterium]NIM82421.1 hypothetical protein [Candidatus Aminicenantes bacterium]NIN21781.1 hypothetical protein [Candidatus Aminicenantes bacterium]NIN45573.1 hypothetical protein [Candidatus Aminicenantes bacterium]NIO84823.1 hypothetical protein [Candidatus Aminicenantes bacterium]